MKLFIILISILLSGCATSYFPKGIEGRKIEYFNAGHKQLTCDYCKKNTTIYKVVSKKKIMCPDCFEIKVIKTRIK